jgi:hypothetical protein
MADQTSTAEVELSGTHEGFQVWMNKSLCKCSHWNDVTARDMAWRSLFISAQKYGVTYSVMRILHDTITIVTNCSQIVVMSGFKRTKICTNCFLVISDFRKTIKYTNCFLIISGRRRTKKYVRTVWLSKTYLLVRW